MGITNPGSKFFNLFGLNYTSSSLYFLAWETLLGECESPASTARQIIEAHRLFHFFKVIVHGKKITEHAWYAEPCYTTATVPYSMLL